MDSDGWCECKQMFLVSFQSPGAEGREGVQWSCIHTELWRLLPRLVLQECRQNLWVPITWFMVEAFLSYVSLTGMMVVALESLSAHQAIRCRNLFPCTFIVLPFTSATVFR